MISFIVPAHNEEAWVGRCISAIRGGLESLGEPHEIIVVSQAEPAYFASARPFSRRVVSTRIITPMKMQCLSTSSSARAGLLSQPRRWSLRVAGDWIIGMSLKEKSETICERDFTQSLPVLQVIVTDGMVFSPECSTCSCGVFL
jgi:hypothetical protein